MRGFIFSIEAILTITILLGTIILIGTFFVNENNITPITNFNNNLTNNIYYNFDELEVSEFKIVYCENLILYNNDTNSFEEKKYCEGIR
jgi:hypothetical protein